MAWFKKKEEYTTLRPKRVQKKVDVPEGMFTRCEDENCQSIIYNKDLEQNLMICPKCGYHFKLSVEQRIALLTDEGSFTEMDKNLRSTDPLNFTDTKKYKDRIQNLMKENGIRDAAVSGIGKINGIQSAISIMDFSFIGGSMGSVVGEKVTRTIERGIERRIPVVVVSQTGGARMQEGILSLMQMAKTSCALAELHKERIPFISILVDPTTAGVMASYASLGDVILAEPKALIGFAGPRVIEQTIRQPLPPGFQKSEFLLKHGMLDMVVHRKDLKNTVGHILDMLSWKTCAQSKTPVQVHAPVLNAVSK